LPRPIAIFELWFRRRSSAKTFFYGFNVFALKIPPLRERREDIPLLVNYFVSKLSRRMGKQIK
jgi:transcriptional regulator with GAF, ATPase, and Fis domain